MARFRRLAPRIYASFLIAALLPMLVAAWASLDHAQERIDGRMQTHLRSEISASAEGLGRFLDQVRREVTYLAASPRARGLARAIRDGGADGERAAALERAFSAFATDYPHLDQLRFLDAGGRERVRVHRRDGRLHAVARGRAAGQERALLRRGGARHRGRRHLPLAARPESGIR